MMSQVHTLTIPVDCRLWFGAPPSCSRSYIINTRHPRNSVLVWEAQLPLLKDRSCLPSVVYQSGTVDYGSHGKESLRPPRHCQNLCLAVNVALSRQAQLNNMRTGEKRL